MAGVVCRGEEWQVLVWRGGLRQARSGKFSWGMPSQGVVRQASGYGESYGNLAAQTGNMAAKASCG